MARNRSRTGRPFRPLVLVLAALALIAGAAGQPGYPVELVMKIRRLEAKVRNDSGFAPKGTPERTEEEPDPAALEAVAVLVDGVAPTEAQERAFKTLQPSLERVRVHFRVGRTSERDVDARDWDRLDALVRNADSEDLLIVRGRYSPNLPSDLDVVLAQERRTTVKNWIMDRFGIPTERVCDSVVDERLALDPDDPNENDVPSYVLEGGFVPSNLRGDERKRAALNQSATVTIIPRSLTGRMVCSAKGTGLAQKENKRRQQRTSREAARRTTYRLAAEELYAFVQSAALAWGELADRLDDPEMAVVSRVCLDRYPLDGGWTFDRESSGLAAGMVVGMQSGRPMNVVVESALTPHPEDFSKRTIRVRPIRRRDPYPPYLLLTDRAWWTERDLGWTLARKFLYSEWLERRYIVEGERLSPDDANLVVDRGLAAFRKDGTTFRSGAGSEDMADVPEYPAVVSATRRMVRLCVVEFEEETSVQAAMSMRLDGVGLKVELPIGEKSWSQALEMLPVAATIDCLPGAGYYYSGEKQLVVFKPRDGAFYADSLELGVQEREAIWRDWRSIDWLRNQDGEGSLDEATVRDFRNYLEYFPPSSSLMRCLCDYTKAEEHWDLRGTKSPKRRKQQDVPRRVAPPPKREELDTGFEALPAETEP